MIVVAHPDDEAIFFFSTIRELRQEGFSVRVVCVTGDFGNAVITTTRLNEFYDSCRRLGVQGQTLRLEDRRGGSLCLASLLAGLRACTLDSFDRVYTHGPWGDYGHLHHAGVCHAVHEVFGEGVFSLAGPLGSQSGHVLSEAEYRAKLEHLATSYPSQRFAWPWATAQEAFAEFRPQEAMFLARVALGIAVPPWRSEREEGSRIRIQVLNSFLRGYSGSADTIPHEVREIPKKVWCERIEGFRITLENSLAG